jgi:hypothetical protein
MTCILKTINLNDKREITEKGTNCQNVAVASASKNLINSIALF